MAAARVYTPEALDTVLAIMRRGESDTVRLGAAREVLDRGHGKAPQAITGADGGAISLSALILLSMAPDAA